MDITERKMAEAKLAEASNLLETLLDEFSPTRIYFKDLHLALRARQQGVSKNCSTLPM